MLKLTYTDDDKEMYWEHFERDKDAVVSFLDAWGYDADSHGCLMPERDGIFAYYIDTRVEVHSVILDVLNHKFGSNGRLKIEQFRVYVRNFHL